MRTLFLDCGMGAAGDMLSAALYELMGDDERKEYLKELKEAGIPGVEIEAQSSSRRGIAGTMFRVKVEGVEEGDDFDHYGHENDHHHEHEHRENAHHHEEIDHSGHSHDHDHYHRHGDDHDFDHEHHHDHEHHDHDHTHEHSHHHTSMKDIEELIKTLKVSEKVKTDVKEVYRLIAEAESRAHGTEVSMIHFHEVGMMDAVADITAVCLAMEKLGPERVVCSPVHVGSGSVRCRHGIMPVPAPATANILTGVPIYGGSIKGELCTPTGAALLKYFSSDFGDMPLMSVERTGYGLGKKDFEAANCVRAMLGETEEGEFRPHGQSVRETAAPHEEQILGLYCNVDDMTGEEMGFAMERLLEAGALDVFTIPAGMKKSRPGTVFCVLLRPQDRERLVREIFKHTTTIGIRESEYKRYVLRRGMTEQDTGTGKVRIKESEGYGVIRKKPEFEDMAELAGRLDISLMEARELLRGNK
ncbi:MAG: nickel pincer cofactor biosynthesis protein LarC [Lachnospiraceae bacterium]|nr:nickel pincer cofactor biosynthesis protein LarC [Lachnospiraceae bacterium]